MSACSAPLRPTQKTPRFIGPAAFGYETTIVNTRDETCELCELTRSTTWYAEHSEPFPFTILDCDSCDVPMAVIGEHKRALDETESEVVRRELARVADEKYPQGWVYDDNMRQIPDHYHIHARPYPPWWKKK